MSKNEFTCDCNSIHHETVSSLIKILPSSDVFENVSLFFKALGDTTRIRIIWALEKEELCVCDLANILSMSKSAVSHQLSTLRKAKLVKYRRDGKTVYYSLMDSHVKNMFISGFAHIHE